MAEPKNEKTSDKEAEIDMAALELQIDQEIDSLFMPVARKTEALEEEPPAVPAEELGAEIEMEIEAPEAVAPAPAIPAPPANSEIELSGLRLEKDDEAGAGDALSFPEGASSAAPTRTPDMQPPTSGLDLNAFQAEIDREIDSLFSPAAEPPPVLEQAEAPEPPPALPVMEPAAPARAPDMQPLSSELELNAFQTEIDREIDSLFSPAAELPPVLERAEAPEPPPALPVMEPVAPARAPDMQPPSAELDLNAFQTEIDREIDSLFSPAAELPPVLERAEAFEPPPVTPVMEPAAPPVPEFSLEELMAPEPTVAPPPPLAMAAPEEVEEPIAAPTAAPPEVPSELPKLVETFNAAYLTLDWDFSPENIYALELALSELEPYARRSPGTEPLFKMLKGILPRLRAKPHAASPQVIELIRDAQGLMAHMLLSEGPLGAHERERLRGLLGRFRAMRERAIAAKEAKAEAGAHKSARAAAKAAEREELLSASLEAPAGEAKLPDRWSLREVRAWVEASADSLAQMAAVLEPQLSRMEQVEEILAKSQALGPVVTRIVSIRENVSRHLEELMLRSAEWKERAEWVSSLEKVVETHEAATAPKPAARMEEPPVPEEAPISKPRKTRRESVYVFSFGGRPFALPASSVVKIQSLSPKKARALVHQGYATLAQFKPLFRPIKTGVLGEWKDSSAAALKDWRFTPVRPEVFQMTEMPPVSETAIFVSNGTEGAVILADSSRVSLVPDAQITIEPSSCTAAIGSIQVESGLCAQVLDLDRVVASQGRK